MFPGGTAVPYTIWRASRCTITLRTDWDKPPRYMYAFNDDYL